MVSEELSTLQTIRAVDEAYSALEDEVGYRWRMLLYAVQYSAHPLCCGHLCVWGGAGSVHLPACTSSPLCRWEGIYFKKGYSEGLRRCKVFSLQLQRMVVMLWASELGKASTNNTASWWKWLSPDKWGRKVLLSEFAVRVCQYINRTAPIPSICLSLAASQSMWSALRARPSHRPS